MPTYVYRFIDSGETIEVRQAFEDDALTQAPHPSDGVLRPVKKVFTPVGVTFKGSGFYKTDSGAAAKTSKSTPASGESSGAATGPANGESSGAGSGAAAGESSKPTAPSQPTTTATAPTPSSGTAPSTSA
ncbi:MAG: FmdB family transcriptional regulator [Acidimicrobiaceae bacterium]|nr:FmdB family transcriptional regulator [Acidimicrobiaceae bacterium]